MLKIGVQFSRQVDDVGEYLADASALEAAGVDSIWMDGGSGQDPWMQLAAIAAVTGRVRLAISIDPVDQRSPEVLSQRLSTLQCLSRGRAIVALEAADEGGYRLERANAPPERWTRVDVPDAREGWKVALRTCEDAGATGVIVPFGPRLLDMLRRPDEEDDRSDLLVAQG